MSFVNEVRISGRATKDAIKTGNGPYRFGLAHGGGKKRNSEDRWPTEFFDVACWHDTAAEVKKGNELLVVGRLRQSTWEQDGQKRSRVEIVATELQSDDHGKSLPMNSPEALHPPRERKIAEHRPITAQDPISDEDIPF